MIVNINCKPENPFVARHPGVAINSIHSQAFYLVKNMSKFKKRIVDLPLLCACGCYEPVKWNKYKNRWNTFILGHHVRINPPSKRQEVAQKISEALMGRECPHMIGENNWSYGKTGKLSPVYGKDKYAQEKAKLPPLCACGCKEKTKWCNARKQWNKYIIGHYIRIKNPMDNPETVKKVSGKNSNLFGKTGKEHPAYGTQTSKSKREKTSKALMGNQNGKGIKRNKKFCENQRRIMLNGGSERANSFRTPESYTAHTEYMLNGGAAYLNSFIKNPSRPQVELFKLTKSLYPQAILNHPSLNFSIDIAIPDKNIAIEYDEPYWHDEEKDNKRQKKLENVGWRFLRYVSNIPTIDELRKELRKYDK